MSNLDDLPVDLWRIVLSYLPVIEAIRHSHVSKRWIKALHHPAALPKSFQATESCVNWDKEDQLFQFLRQCGVRWTSARLRHLLRVSAPRESAHVPPLEPGPFGDVTKLFYVSNQIQIAPASLSALDHVVDLDAEFSGYSFDVSSTDRIILNHLAPRIQVLRISIHHLIHEGTIAALLQKATSLQTLFLTVHDPSGPALPNAINPKCDVHLMFDLSYISDIVSALNPWRPVAARQFMTVQLVIRCVSPGYEDKWDKAVNALKGVYIVGLHLPKTFDPVDIPAEMEAHLHALVWGDIQFDKRPKVLQFLAAMRSAKRPWKWRRISK